MAHILSLSLSRARTLCTLYTHAIPYNIVQYNVLQYTTVQYYAMYYCTVQCSCILIIIQYVYFSLEKFIIFFKLYFFLIFFKFFKNFQYFYLIIYFLIAFFFILQSTEPAIAEPRNIKGSLISFLSSFGNDS